MEMEMLGQAVNKLQRFVACLSRFPPFAIQVLITSNSNLFLVLDYNFLGGENGNIDFTRQAPFFIESFCFCFVFGIPFL